MSPRSWTSLAGTRELTLLAACLAALAAFSLLSPHFATAANLAVVARNSVELLFVGLGMTLVLAIGGIDVSVGMALGLVAILIGRLMLAGQEPAAALALGPLAGAALGLVTAAVIVAGRIPAIIATLGLMGVLRAVIYLALGGEWVSGVPDPLTRLMTGGLLGLPLVAWLLLAAYALAYLLMRWSPFGLHVLAIGNNAERARLAGVPVRRTQMLVYVASGALAGLAAVSYVATYRNVEMTVGSTLALDAIVAVVLGGTSVLGGRASLVGTVLGVVLLRILQNGLLLSGVASLWQSVVTGGLLLAILAAEGAFGTLGARVLGRRA